MVTIYFRGGDMDGRTLVVDGVVEGRLAFDGRIMPPRGYYARTSETREVDGVTCEVWDFTD